MPDTVQEARKARKQGTRSEFTKSSKVFARLQDQQVPLQLLSLHMITSRCEAPACLRRPLAICAAFSVNGSLGAACFTSRLRHCTVARSTRVGVCTLAFRVQPGKRTLSVMPAQVADAAAKAGGGGRFAAAPPSDAVPAERFKL